MARPSDAFTENGGRSFAAVEAHNSDPNAHGGGLAPTAHATTHKSGGSDAIKLDELAAPTDVTTLNASTTAHGLMPKGTGSTSTYYRSDLTQANPLAIGNAVGSGTAGSILYLGASGVLAQYNSSFFFDASNAWIGIGSKDTEWPITTKHDNTTHTQGLWQGSNNADGPSILGLKCRGAITYGASYAIQAGDELIAIHGAGHNGTSWVKDSRGWSSIKAGSNWTTGNNQTYYSIGLTPGSSTTPAEVFRIDGAGRVAIGSTPTAGSRLSIYSSGTYAPCLTLRDGDVSTVNISSYMGQYYAANTLGYFVTASEANGGLSIVGVSASAGTPGTYLDGVVGSASPTSPGVRIRGNRWSGWTDAQAMSATQLVTDFYSASTKLAELYGGAYWALYNGTAPTASVTDGALLYAADISSSSCLHIRAEDGSIHKFGASADHPGAVLAHSGTAIPAGGTAGAGYRLSSTSNFGVFFGSGAPTLSAAQGSLYLRSDGAPYYNSSSGSGTTWTALSGGGGGGGTPDPHAASHMSAGSDPIRLDELKAPTDVTTLNASTTAHGLLRKLDGTTTNFLRGDGTWAAPSASLSIGTSITSGTSGSILYVNSSGQLAQYNGAFFFDATKAWVSFGTNTAEAPITIAYDNASFTQQFQYASATAVGPCLLGIKARGTFSSATASISGDELIGIHGGGHNGTSWVKSSKGWSSIKAGATWSGSTNETYYSVGLTPASSTTAAEVFRIDGAGRVAIGSTPTAGSRLSVYSSGTYAPCLTLRDGDVSTPNISSFFGQYYAANTVGYFVNGSEANGGLSITGLSASSGSAGLYLYGFVGSTAPTAPGVRINAVKHNGGTDAQAVAATEKAIDFYSNSAKLAELYGGGYWAIYNGTAPTASVTDGVLLYAADVSSSSELRVRDEAGNVTTLSPHNRSLLGPSDHPLAWTYYSERPDLGRSINVDMYKAIRALEKLTGERFIFEGTVPTDGEAKARNDAAEKTHPTQPARSIFERNEHSGTPTNDDAN